MRPLKPRELLKGFGAVLGWSVLSFIAQCVLVFGLFVVGGWGGPNEFEFLLTDALETFYSPAFHLIWLVTPAEWYTLGNVLLGLGVLLGSMVIYAVPMGSVAYLVSHRLRARRVAPPSG